MHTDAGSSRRNQFRCKFQRFLRGKIEHRRNFRMLVRKGRVLNHIFTAAYDPFRNQILDMVIGIVTVLFKDSDPQQVIDHCLCFFFTHVVPCGKFFGGTADTALFKAQQELYFFFGEQAIEDPEIHVILMHAAGQFAGNIICNHFCQLNYKLLFFRIITVIVGKGKIPFIDMDPGIYFSWHIVLLVV